MLINKLEKLGAGMRVFVGLPLSDEAKRGVAKVEKMLLKKHWRVRWIEEVSWHATAAFVGETADKDEILRLPGLSHQTRHAQDDKYALKSLANLSGIERAVERAAMEKEPFEVGFKGLGAFPDLLLPKTIWVGMRGNLKSMYGLVKEIRKQLELEKISFDKQTFRPHISLGRVEHGCGRRERLEIGKQVMKLRVMDIPQRWRVSEVVVYESRLGESGAVYKPLVTVKLGG